MWVHLWKQKLSVPICVTSSQFSEENIHQKVALYNGWLMQWISATLVLAQEFWKRKIIMAEMEAMHMSRIMGASHQRWSSCCHCWMPHYQHWRPTLSPWYSSIPWGDQLATWWQIVWNKSIPPGRYQGFIYISGMSFPSLPTEAQLAELSKSSQSILIEQHRIPPNITLNLLDYKHR